MPNVLPCPICVVPAERQRLDLEAELIRIDCPDCTRFDIAGLLVDDLEKRFSVEDRLLFKNLQAAAQYYTEQGDTLRVDRGNWRLIARAHARPAERGL